MTTAMIELKMKDLSGGHLGAVVEDRLRHADEGGAQALLMNSAMVTRSVGMPALRALTASPPMARIQLPNREKFRMSRR